MFQMIKFKLLVKFVYSLTAIVCLLVLWNYSIVTTVISSTYKQFEDVRHYRQIINSSSTNHSYKLQPFIYNDTAVKNINKVRVLCWIMTHPGNSARKKCTAVRKTWGKRCDVLLFFSSKPDSDFPIIGLNVSEGRNHLTAKTMEAFDYIYKHHFNDADWFMKADDDSYVIVENLKYMLSQKPATDPVYYGQVFTTFVKPHGYNSGGAGYVVSKEALTRFGQRKKSLCKMDGGIEDVDFGFCLKRLKVFAGNSFDETGRSRFHGLQPYALLHTPPAWYAQYDLHSGKRGISRYAISFHYMTYADMYIMDFALHHIKAYGHTFPPYRENDNGEEKSPYL